MKEDLCHIAKCGSVRRQHCLRCPDMRAQHPWMQHMFSSFSRPTPKTKNPFQCQFLGAFQLWTERPASWQLAPFDPSAHGRLLDGMSASHSLTVKHVTTFVLEKALLAAWTENEAQEASTAVGPVKLMLVPLATPLHLGRGVALSTCIWSAWKGQQPSQNCKIIRV